MALGGRGDLSALAGERFLFCFVLAGKSYERSNVSVLEKIDHVMMTLGITLYIFMFHLNDSAHNKMNV